MPAHDDHHHSRIRNGVATAQMYGTLDALTDQREHRREAEARAAYRVSLGSTPASVGLSELVEREVAAHRRRTALDADGVRDAVRDARAVAGELEVMIARLETASQTGSAAASPTLQP